MKLKSIPNFEQEVEPSLNYARELIEEGLINADFVFYESNLLNQIVSSKIKSWSEEEVSSEMRWIDVFKELKLQNRPIINIELLVELAFAVPGSSTQVERLFSIINDTLVPNKDHMSLTLEAFLNIKVNSNLSCPDYYLSIKNKLIVESSKW
jgi:hypothetical protein